MRALWYSYKLSIPLDSEVSGLHRSGMVSTSSRVMWDGNSLIVLCVRLAFIIFQFAQNVNIKSLGAKKVPQ